MPLETDLNKLLNENYHHVRDSEIHLKIREFIRNNDSVLEGDDPFFIKRLTKVGRRFPHTFFSKHELEQLIRFSFEGSQLISVRGYHNSIKNKVMAHFDSTAADFAGILYEKLKGNPQEKSERMHLLNVAYDSNVRAAVSQEKEDPIYSSRCLAQAALSAERFYDETGDVYWLETSAIYNYTIAKSFEEAIPDFASKHYALASSAAQKMFSKSRAIEDLKTSHEFSVQSAKLIKNSRRRAANSYSYAADSARELYVLTNDRTWRDAALQYYDSFLEQVERDTSVASQQTINKINDTIKKLNRA